MMPRKDGKATRAELAEAGRLEANRRYIARADDAEVIRLALDPCVQADPDVAAMVRAEQAARA